MRSTFRRLAASALVAAVALTTSATAGAAPQKAYRAKANPGFASDVARLAPAKPYQAFVHFAPGLSDSAQSRHLSSRGFRIGMAFPGIDTIFAQGTVGAFRKLQADRAVSYLEREEHLKLAGDTATWASRARVARQPASGGPFRDANGHVIDGTGVGVAVVDGGVYGTHPDLKNRMARNFKLVCPDPGVVSTSLANPCGLHIEFEEVEDSDTSSGHGTHVAGIVAGDGTASAGVNDSTFVGVAPGAKLYGFGTGDGDSINTYLAAASFQWVIDNGATQNPPVRVVTNSWGCATTAGGCAYNASDTVNQLATQLVNNGVSVLFAAGNDGGNGTTVCYSGGQGDCTSGTSKNPTPGVISVANYDDSTPNDLGTGDRDNTLDSSSSRGSANAARYETWPDISAPGTVITSTCKPNTAICAIGPDPSWAPNYGLLSGTSMATPHVAGAIAMLYEANPSLTPAQVEDVLQDNAYKYTGGTGAPGAYVTDPQNPGGGTSSYDKGAGLLDVPATLAALGVVKDGVGRNGPATVPITAPANNSSQSGTVAVSGTAYDGSIDPLGTQTLSTGDAGDYTNGPGAADLDALFVQAGATGVTYTIRSRNVSDVGPGSVRYWLVQNVNGKHQQTQVTVDATSAFPTAASTTNTALATSASRNVAGNTVSFVVPYTNLGNPPANSPAHNVWVWSYVVTPGGSLRQDIMPGGLTDEVTTKPQFTMPYTVNPTSTPTKAATVTLSLDGGPASAASLSGSSPNYTWSGSVSVAAALPGTHTIKATLKLDGLARTSSTVTVIKPGTNAPPIAVAQSVGVAKDASKLITLVGSDPENAPFTFKVASLPAHGQLFNGPNDSYPLVGAAPFTLSSKKVTYKPASAYAGADSFTFKTNDGNSDSSAATVTLSVLATTTTTIRPSFMGQWSSSNEEAPGAQGTFVYGPGTPPVGPGSFRQQAPTGSKQYMRTTDANGVSLSGANLGYSTYTAASGPNALTPALSIYLDTNGDSISDERLSFEPYEQSINGYGPATAFGAWQTWDASAGVWWSSIDGINAPRFTLSEYLARPGKANAKFALFNQGAFQLVAGSTGSSWPNFDGNADRVVINGSIFNFDPDNSAPIANSQSAATLQNTPKTLTLTASDADGDALTYRIVTLPAHGTLHNGASASDPAIAAPATALSSDKVTYVPDNNYTGPDAFDFQASDGTLTSNTATVSLTVQASNVPPVANAQSVTTAEDTSTLITLTGSDADSNPLTFKVTSLPANGKLYDGATQITTVPTTLSGTMVTYSPNADYNGADSFQFKANDGIVDSTAATVSITVTPVNDAPVASDQAVTTPEDTPKTITLSGTDVDGDTLTFKVMTLPANGTLHDGATIGAPVITTVPYTLASNKTTYEPAANYFGPDALTFKARDGSVDSTNTGTVSISVTSVNDPPVANAQSVTLAEDSSTAITLTGSDVDGNPITFKVTQLPANGKLYNGPTTGAPQITSVPVTTASSVVTYAPNANYNGADAFQFRANDGAVDSAPATVSITVTPVNDAPDAQAQSISVTTGQSKTVTLTGTDVDGTPLSFKIATLPSNGTLYDGTTTAAPQVVAAPYTLASNKVTYKPTTGYTGSDAFDFVAYDGQVDSAPATVSITVSAGDTTPPNAPVINAPANGSLKPKTFVISGTAEHDSTVRIYRDGQAAPFATTTAAAGAGDTAWSVSVSNVPSGNHTIQATATDAALNASGFSNLVSFEVDAVSPTVTITSPAGGTVFLPASPVVVTGTASDSRYLSYIQVRYRNTTLGTSTVRTVNATCGGGSCAGTGTKTWQDSTTLPAGTYDVIATAYDQAGNLAGTALVGFIVIGV